MMRALNTAASGMAAQQTNVDVIAHNLANVNTTGFRKQRAEFEDLIYQTIRTPGGTTGEGQKLPTGIQIGEGVRVVSTTQMHHQGSLIQTESTLDVAVEGDGFFQITRPGGQIAYTRAGNFRVDAEGRMVTVDGYQVEPAISIPTNATAVTISPNGLVSVQTAGSTATQDVGQLTLANFVNPSGLLAIGRTMFVPTDASGEAITGQPGQEGLGTLASGFLEASNVEVVQEMIDLIASQRAYEVNQRVITTADEMLQRVTDRL
ncbi:MAG TPA: flagellar basal-body rod protein FlgG [Polyangiales bacterium]|jgi:flagellar basal-body rod protein FlgG|nr:flagellar basal-body rod protein FlgG [Polyangiales bacterium]